MKTLKDYRGCHAQEHVVVVGLGESIRVVSHLSDYITIGVNDCSRIVHPTYLLLCDPPSRFTKERLTHILRTKCEAVFIYPSFLRDWQEFEHAAEWGDIVPCSMDGSLHPRCFKDHWIPSVGTSTYPAAGLAAYMGATKVGLIGVDFQPKRFWEKVGLARICDGQSVKQLIASYNGLARFLASMGIELVNLSKTSRLEIAKGEIKDFKERYDDPKNQGS